MWSERLLQKISQGNCGRLYIMRVLLNPVLGPLPLQPTMMLLTAFLFALATHSLGRWIAGWSIPWTSKVSHRYKPGASCRVPEVHRFGFPQRTALTTSSIRWERLIGVSGARPRRAPKAPMPGRLSWRWGMPTIRFHSLLIVLRCRNAFPAPEKAI